MTRPNAIGFLFLGFAMLALPELFPSWVGAPGAGGGEVCALWLDVMGALIATLGGLRLLRELVVSVVWPALRTALGAIEAPRGATAPEPDGARSTG